MAPQPQHPSAQTELFSRSIAQAISGGKGPEYWRQAQICLKALQQYITRHLCKRELFPVTLGKLEQNPQQRGSSQDFDTELIEGLRERKKAAVRQINRWIDQQEWDVENVPVIANLLLGNREDHHDWYDLVVELESGERLIVNIKYTHLSNNINTGGGWPVLGYLLSGNEKAIPPNTSSSNNKQEFASFLEQVVQQNQMEGDFFRDAPRADYFFLGAQKPSPISQQSPPFEHMTVGNFWGRGRVFNRAQVPSFQVVLSRASITAPTPDIVRARRRLLKQVLKAIQHTEVEKRCLKAGNTLL